MKLPADTVRDRIRFYREAKGFSKADLARAVDVEPSQITRWESGERRPNDFDLLQLAFVLGVSVPALTIGRREFDSVRAFFSANPKPVRLGDIVVPNSFLLFGNHEDEITLHAEYRHDPLFIPPKLRKLYNELAVRAEKSALGKHLYFNGPNTRLVRATEVNTSSEGEKGVKLDLAPVSWEEYTVLNTFLDTDLFTEGEGTTLRQRYADESTLFECGCDLSWCPLSNLLTVNMTPITSDGFAVIQLRSRSGVSVGAHRFTSGVTENIHRWKDEASPLDLTRRLHLLGERPPDTVNELYKPKGIPSPFLTAERGLAAELSKALLWRLRPDNFKFLNLVMDLELFTPHLVGVIELGRSKKEVQEAIEENIGEENEETAMLFYLPLDLSENNMTIDLADTRWNPDGLSAFVTAVKYHQAKSKSKDFPK